MSYRIKIDYDGYGEEWLTHLESQEIRAVGKKDVADLYCPTDELNPQDIDKGRDRAYLLANGEEYFGGIIEDVRRNGHRKDIFVESFERLGERAEPGPAVERWENSSDSRIIKDAISNVDGLQAGSIETTNNSVSLLLSHASPAYKARRAADVSTGFMLFRPDGTVDYGNLGQDKSHYTLSPRNDNVSSEFEIDEKASYEHVTHLRMLGAGEQEHQITATAVSDDYDGGEQIWRTYADKGISDQETLQSKANHYVEELSTVKLEVTLTVKGVQCALGDTFRVYLPTENVDEVLEVVEHKRIIDTEGIKHKITLSNHRDTRETPRDKKTIDVSNYNSAIEGTTLDINGGGSRQPVDSSLNWQTIYEYLEGVVYEHRVELKVEGQAYRAYSSGAASGGGEHSHTTEINTTSADNADWESTAVSKSEVDGGDITSAWGTIGNVTPSEPTSKLKVGGSFSCIQSGGSTEYPTAQVDYRLVAQTDSGTLYHPDNEGAAVTFNAENSQLGSIPELEIPLDLEGDTVELQARLGGSYDGDWSLNSRILWQGAGRHNHTIEETATSSEEVGEHTHGPEFGILEQDADGNRHYPSNCDVLINGQSMGVSLGDGNGEFSEVVDLEGELQEGDNRIEVTSDSLGHVQAFLQGEAVRRIHGRTS